MHIAAAVLSILVAQSLSTATAQVKLFGSVLTLDLPPGIPSETIQIMTELGGEFGAVGSGFVAQPPDKRVIEIDLSHNGKLAKEILLTAYMPGCELVIMQLPLTDNPTPRVPLVCTSLPKISISGSVPPEFVQGHQAELTIEYWGNWKSFMLDGFVHLITLARVPVEKDGTFRSEITDFSKYERASSSALPRSLYFSLRDAKTWNLLGPDLWLTAESANLRTSMGGVKVEPAYPQGLRFVPAN
jgi:hypothetical protein